MMAKTPKTADAVKAGDIKAALARRHEGREFFLAECKTGPTQFGPGLLIFDGLAIYKSWAHPRIVGYEVKVSRSDFRADNKYRLYLPYCHEFYFVCPTGMIDRSEIEPDMGLMYYNPEKKSLITKLKAPHRDVEISGEMLMYIIMNRLESDRHPFHSSEREFWEAWIAQRESDRRLGWHVKGQLGKRIGELADFKRQAEYRWKNEDELDQQLEAVRKILVESNTVRGPISRHNLAEKVGEALGARTPLAVDDAEVALERALKALRKMKGGTDGQTDTKREATGRSCVPADTPR